MPHEYCDKNGVTVLRLQGPELSFSTVESFQEAVQQRLTAGCVRLLLDFSAIDFMDSMGIGSLIAARNLLQQRQGLFGLASVGDQVMKSLRLTQLHMVFAIYEDVPQGVAAMAASCDTPEPATGPATGSSSSTDETDDPEAAANH